MGVRFNHTIVPARDRQASAEFLADVLGTAPPFPFGTHFIVVRIDDHATIDFAAASGAIPSMHLAFLVDEADFDGIFARILERGIDHWADPALTQPGEINSHDGGRAVYFQDPDGHLLEALTVPYGGF